MNTENYFEADEYGFPLRFPDEVLAKMREQLSISQEVFRNIHNYFDAAGNLYARIPLRVLYEIYNSQNDPVSEEDFLEAAKIIAHERKYYAILQKSVFYPEMPLMDPMDHELVYEHLYALGDDHYGEMERAQEGKPWYVPEREEFLKYADSFYIEETPQFFVMVNYLQNTQRKLKCSPREIAEEMSELLRMDYSLNEVVKDVQRLGVRFQNQEDLRMFVKLCLNLSHHSRRYVHCGHTPAELGISLKLDEVMQEIDYDENYQDRLESMAQIMRYHIMGSSTITGKPAKNSPCPCGSGRKYKNCCGKEK